MSWDTVTKYIEALPTGIELQNKNEDVTFCGEKVQVMQSHNLFVQAIKSAPNDNIVSFLNEYLKENAAFVDDEQISSLQKELSQQMNKLKMEVKISEPLIEALRSAIRGNYRYKANDNFTKSLSVVLRLTDLPAESLGDCGDIKCIKPLLPNLNFNSKGIFCVKVQFEETIYEGDVTSIQAVIALVVVLKCLPEAWRKDFMWDAWLAVTIQLSLLKVGKEIFPCQWMKQVFHVESLVTPDKVRCVLFGQDPVSENAASESMRKATGIAFHAVGDGNPSIKKMKEKYHINCDGDAPIDHCREGRLLLNMIRCIEKGNNSVSANNCRAAWIAYTLKFAHYFSEKKKLIIMFCNFPSALPQIYMPNCVDPKNFMRVPHPTTKYLQPTTNVKDQIDKLYK